LTPEESDVTAFTSISNASITVRFLISVSLIHIKVVSFQLLRNIVLLFLGCVTFTQCIDVTSYYRCSVAFVSVSACLLEVAMSRAKMIEPIEMPFGMSAAVGARNHVLDGGPYLPWAQGRSQFLVAFPSPL